MKSLRHRLATSLLRGLGIMAYRLSPKHRAWLGVCAGKILQFLSASRRRITRENLQRAFPEKSAEWVQATARGSYRNLGTTLVELLTFPHITPSETRAMIELRGTEAVEEEVRKGRGVVLVSGHFGNWELLAFAFPLYTNIPTSVIVAPQSNKYAEEYLHWYRSRTGNRMIPMGKAARAVVERLNNGEAIALLADQAATADRDLFVPFFGTPAATYEAPAALTLKRNAPMFAAFAVREADGRYTAELERIPHEDLLPDKDGIIELTRRHVAVLENAIRERPDLWAWQHRRWKHRAEP